MGELYYYDKSADTIRKMDLGGSGGDGDYSPHSVAYSRPKIPVTGKTSVTIPAGTRLMIGGKRYQTEQGTPLAITGITNRAGKDLYIYACEPISTGSDTPKFVLSANSTIPDGYTADNSRKIGGFHCLCADVGTISGHPLSGYLAGEILPGTIWDLRHRPKSDPAGMVYIDELDYWFDIYLASWDGNKLVSQFGAVVADGESSKKFHGELFEELFARTAKKSLLSRKQFLTAAYGSPVHVVIAGAADPNTTGGHTATNGQRIISHYGLEDCTGVYWQWTSDIFEGGPYGALPNINNPDDSKYLSYTGWSNYSIYSSNADNGSDFGGALKFIRRALVGADFQSQMAPYSGSRCIDCNDASGNLSYLFSSRGASAPFIDTTLS